jgi:glycine hydroxymethyltransferase
MACQTPSLRILEQTDPEVWRICRQEQDRQANTLELIASENHVSQAVMQIVGSVFTNKYAEGYPGRRYYGGCEFMDAVENLARDRAKQLFGAEHVNVQPHSGTQANMAVYMAVLKPGDTLLCLDLDHGGHLSHGMRVNFSGQLYKVCSYGVDAKTEQFDYDAIRDKARECRPRMIVCGASAYPRTIDFEAFSDIAAEVGAYLMADIAHIAGMVAVGLHPSPVPVADFVTTTTHKTLRGPRAGMVLCKAKHAQAVDKTVFPGIQGGPLMHVIAGKAVAFAEALRPGFKAYQQQILTNAGALAESLAEAGYRLVSGGTDNHLMLVDLRTVLPDVTGRMAENWLERACIIVNKNMIPFDDRRPAETSGLRLGTPALTTRGMKPDQMKTIAQLIHRVLDSRGDDQVVQQVCGEVRQLCEQFPLPH